MGSLDEARHGPTLARRDRRLLGSAPSRGAVALGRDRDRGDRPVPKGQRRAGGQRAGLRAGRWRRRPDSDRRLLRHFDGRPRGPRCRLWPRPHARRHSRDQHRRLARLRGRQRAGPGDLERAE